MVHLYLKIYFQFILPFITLRAFYMHAACIEMKFNNKNYYLYMHATIH